MVTHDYWNEWWIRFGLLTDPLEGWWLIDMGRWGWTWSVDASLVGTEGLQDVARCWDSQWLWDGDCCQHDDLIPFLFGLFAVVAFILVLVGPGGIQSVIRCRRRRRDESVSVALEGEGRKMLHCGQVAHTVRDVISSLFGDIWMLTKSSSSPPPLGLLVCSASAPVLHPLCWQHPFIVSCPVCPQSAPGHDCCSYLDWLMADLLQFFHRSTMRDNTCRCKGKRTRPWKQNHPCPSNPIWQSTTDACAETLPSALWNASPTTLSHHSPKQ